jgi:endonuclease-3 related protein
MIGAILTQNTAWSNVERAIENLKDLGLTTAKTILDCNPPTLATALKPSGYFNIKAGRLKSFCRWYIDQGGLDVLRQRPTAQLRDDLLAVKGIGPETADDILLYAFERPVFVIDAYTRRLFSRLRIIDGSETYEQLRGGFESSLERDAALFNEYHALIVRHGKDICRRNPDCGGCGLAAGCPSRE